MTCAFGAALLFIKGPGPDRCTQAARQLARGFFKTDLIPRTSLNELDKVEQYLNRGKQLSYWIGIRAYVPVRQENGDINWHLVRNPCDKLKNIITIGIYEGHAFLIKDIKKLAKTYVCNDCEVQFTQAFNFKDTKEHAEKVKRKSSAQKRS